MKIVRIISAVLAMIVGTLVLAYAGGAYIDSIPDVHVSHHSGKCVKVHNYDQNKYSCDFLPTTYNHVWVK